MVQLNDIVVKTDEKNRDHFVLVFDFFEHDLLGLLRNRIRFEMPQVRVLLQQLTEAVLHLHSREILHRDLKSELKRCQCSC